MLDFDLAILYEVQTKVLNQAVKRNKKRFPIDFMFRLTPVEWKNMRSQIVTASLEKRNTTALPYAFTEQGVAMLSGILSSDRAIKMNIAIMRAFVEVRRLLLSEGDIIQQITDMKNRLGDHDDQLQQLFEALENLLAEKAQQVNWESRERIGFKAGRKE